MRIPASGMMMPRGPNPAEVPSGGPPARRASALPFARTQADIILARYAPRPKSKKRGVLLRLLAARGWVRGCELHEAYGEKGWCFDSALAQLRKAGLAIDSRKIEGRDEFKYRLVLPDKRVLAPHLTRSAAEIAEREARMRGGPRVPGHVERPRKRPGKDRGRPAPAVAQQGRLL